MYNTRGIKHNLCHYGVMLLLMVALVLGMMPKVVYASEEQEEFVTTAFINHWGRSSLRSHLTGKLKKGDTLPLDTGYVNQIVEGYYGKRLSETEHDLVQSWCYNTNVLDSKGNTTSTYETRDRFVLPSGNASDGKNHVISWGNDDLSSNGQYEKSIQNDKGRMIPISYWSRNSNIDSSWLRSASVSPDNALVSSKGEGVISKHISEGDVAVAPAFKISLDEISFASMASAVYLSSLPSMTEGSKVISIEGSSDFGKKTAADLPNYGMYLKMASQESLDVTSMTFDASKKVTLDYKYSGNPTGQYIVVQAFKEDDLENGSSSYAATKKITTKEGQLEIIVDNWDISSLDGYTIKVWIEDFNLLCKATLPNTFDASSKGIEKTEERQARNIRSFAMKKDLQTSWGDLESLSDEEYQRVISGQSFETGDIHGLNPTNQKIYFGTKDSKQFWIAGRENENGQLDSNGNVMCLYTAQVDDYDRKPFQNELIYYLGKDVITLQLQDGEALEIFGDNVMYPNESIIATQGNKDLKDKLNWEHRRLRESAWESGMPKTAGDYEIRAYLIGTADYERTYSTIVNFKVMNPLNADDFTFVQPTDLIYNGAQKTANIIAKNTVLSDDKITVKYYQNGNQISHAPTDAGTYTVKIDVAESELNLASKDITDASWTFTILPAPLSVKSVQIDDKTYDGNVDATIQSIEFANLLNDDYLKKDVHYTVSAKFADKNVGNNKKVTVNIMLKDYGIAKNYILKDTQINTFANINPKEVVVMPDKHDTPNTKDTSNMQTYVILLLISIASLMVTAFKKENNR